MADENLADIMKAYVKTFEDGDVEKALSFFTEDGAITCPEGTFAGKDNLRRYLEYCAGKMKNIAVKPSGNQIITGEGKAFFEHIIEATIDGKRGSVLAMCAYEFADDKIKSLRTTYDRLTVARQAAQGWIAGTLVNMIVKEAEKGL